MRRALTVLAGAIVIFTMANIAYSAVPARIKYSGILKKRGVGCTGEKVIQYKIYKELSGGEAVWVSSQQPVNIYDGNFACEIEIPGINWNEGPYYLEVTIGESVLSPREEITSTVYALYAGDIDDGKVTTAKIADGAVTSQKIATGTISGINIAENAVATAQLADGAVTDVKVSSISWGKIFGVPEELLSKKSNISNYVSTEAVNLEILSELYDISESTIALKNYIDRVAFSTGTFISNTGSVTFEKADIAELNGITKLTFADGTVQTTAYSGDTANTKKLTSATLSPAVMLDSESTFVGDDLGDHIATMTLDMADYGIINVSSITVSTNTAESERVITGF